MYGFLKRYGLENEVKVAGLTYGSITPEQKADDKKGYGFWEIFHTCVVLGIIVAVYIFFW